MTEDGNGLPELPQGWVWTTVGEVVTFEYGKGLRKDRRDSSGKTPVYGSNGIVGHHSTPLVEVPCLIVGRKGTAGRVHKSNGPCWPIDTTYYVVPPEGIDLSFLYYLLSTLRLGSLDRSTAIPGLNRNDAYALSIPLPPLPEQHRIVAKIEELFTQLDAGVAALEKARAQLRRYRQAVLKAAVEGELTSEWREAHRGEIEPASVLLERILGERRVRWEAEQLARMKAKGKSPKNDRWKRKYKEPALPDTEGLPELPEGWCYTSLAPLLSMHRSGMKTGPFGSLLKKHEHKAEGVPVLGIENVEPMRFARGNKIYVTEEKAAQLSAYDVQANDILISRSGTVGQVCVVPEGLGEARMSTNLMRLVLARDGMLPHFFSLLFNGSPFVLAQVSELCSGSTRDFLNQKILSSVVLSVPPLAEQQRIVSEVERRLSVADEMEKAVEQSLKRAERLRQSILKRAFEGKLVPQDPSDEPASVLLERIKAEKMRREGEGKGKKGRRRRERPRQLELFTS